MRALSAAAANGRPSSIPRKTPLYCICFAGVSLEVDAFGPTALRFSSPAGKQEA